MSEHTEKKARSLIDTKSIVQIADNMYQVKSSTPGKSYFISDGECECIGFRIRKDCSHVQAAAIMTEMTMIQKSSDGTSE